MTLESDAKFEENYCGLENRMKNLANFHQSTWKSQNWDFDWIHLSKVENVWALNLQGRVICPDNEEWYKNSSGIDLSFQNWH